VTDRERLEDERRRTAGRLDRLRQDHTGFVESSKYSNADDEHDPEGATIAFERSQVATLVRQATAHLAEIDSALARVAEGSYGTCERCGRRIPEARLEARPTAVTCIGCAG
jgi:RNA polymerase-binding transcription factor DksA